MKHYSSDKYSIAWFKLAECVSRKEKERAMGVYRLLVHSIADEALAAQLEGDLLLSFDDDAANTKYKKAVELYCKQKRFALAVGVCEHILLLRPHDSWPHQKLIDLYQLMGVTLRQEEIKKQLDKLGR